jgi:hypothetical protein
LVHCPEGYEAIVVVNLVMIDTMDRFDLRPSRPGSPMRW